MQGEENATSANSSPFLFFVKLSNMKMGVMEVKANIYLSANVLKRIENVRVQLFDSKFYRLKNGEAIRQILFYKTGIPQYDDFGSPIPSNQLFKQIKLVFDKQNKVIAARTMSGEPLQALPTSTWVRNSKLRTLTQ